MRWGLTRQWLLVPLALLVILVGAGGFWAHRVIAGNLARSAYSSAVNNATRDIQLARTDGMFPSELQSYSRQISVVRGLNPPADDGLWTTSRDNFYNREAGRLRSVDGSLRHELVRLTAQARATTATLMSRFGSEVREALTDGLTARPYVGDYRNATLDFRGRANLGQYRALTGDIQPKIQAFKHMITVREDDLGSLMEPVLKSRHRLRTARAELAGRLGTAASSGSSTMSAAFSHG